MEWEPFHIRFLKSELEARREKNSRYSLRSFARLLGMDPAALSRILSGKQTLSPKACPKILGKVTISPEDQERFLASVIGALYSLAYLDMIDRVAENAGQEAPDRPSSLTARESGLRGKPMREPFVRTLSVTATEKDALLEKLRHFIDEIDETYGIHGTQAEMLILRVALT